MKKKQTLNKKSIIRIAMLAFSVYMIFSIGSEVFRSARLYYNLSQTSKENERLIEETNRLNNEVLRLQDEDYIQSFVSGTIFQTREGTSVYILPERNDAQD